VIRRIEPSLTRFVAGRGRGREGLRRSWHPGLVPHKDVGAQVRDPDGVHHPQSRPDHHGEAGGRTQAARPQE